MLNENHKMRRKQINTSIRQAALRKRQKEANPEVFSQKNKESCKKYRSRAKKGK